MDRDSALRPIPIGVDDFKKIRDRGYYYVDKTMLIADVLSSGSEVQLFTRPRRFGKTLNLSMIDSFVNIEYKGNRWFEGLDIDGIESVQAFKSSRPVVRLNMKDMPVDSIERFRAKLREIVFDAYNTFEYLKGSEHITGQIRDEYLDSPVSRFDDVKVEGSVKKLCEMIRAHHGVKPVVLIDEYDDPINNSFRTEQYESILSTLRNFYSSTLKSNESMEFAVVTGVMQIAKESIFSGLNNLDVDNVFSKVSDERYGFTSEEVRELCVKYRRPEKFEEAKDWYDGYRFGDADVYNPWSVLKYVKEGFKPGPYWGGTSGNSIIETLLDNADRDMMGELSALGGGGAIIKNVQAAVSMRDLVKDRGSIYSVMVMSGYLKAVPDGDRYALSIPNSEMFKIFYDVVSRRTVSTAREKFEDLFMALTGGDADGVERNLYSIFAENYSSLLLDREKSYQLVLFTAALYCLGSYRISVEEEAGNGRADLIMESRSPTRPNVVMELKKACSEDPRAWEREAAEGLEQIKRKEYFHSLKGRTLLYGACFRNKKAKVLMEEMELRSRR